MPVAKPYSATTVAAALGVSVNTVYRAVNHSGLVKTATQRRVLDYIRQHYPEKLMEQNTAAAKTITVITQCKPEYYWHTSINEMRQVLNSYPPGTLRLRTIFYSGLRNEDDMHDALSHIAESNTDALIVVPVCNAAGRSAISRLAHEMPVLIFNEYGDFGPCFSAHGDGLQEGEEAANMVLLSSPAQKRVLILRSVNLSQRVDDRIKGFRRQLAASPACTVVGELDISDMTTGDYIYNTTMPAGLARLLSDYMAQHPGDDLNAIYIPDGLIAPLCAALVKLGRTDIRCYGHECNDNVRRFFSEKIRGGYVRSDIRAQSRVALRTVADCLLYHTSPEVEEFITPFDSCLIDD